MPHLMNAGIDLEVGDAGAMALPKPSRVVANLFQHGCQAACVQDLLLTI